MPHRPHPAGVPAHAYTSHKQFQPCTLSVPMTSQCSFGSICLPSAARSPSACGAASTAACGAAFLRREDRAATSAPVTRLFLFVVLIHGLFCCSVAPAVRTALQRVRSLAQEKQEEREKKGGEYTAHNHHDDITIKILHSQKARRCCRQLTPLG